MSPLPPSAHSDPAAPAASRVSRFRWAWWLLAYVSLGVGVVGIFVPGLPTTVFILLSAYAASRGSRRLHAYLLRHPVFGSMIEDWEREGSVSRRAKWSATAAMLACATIIVASMWWMGSHRPWMAALPLGCMLVVGTWLWRRPEPRRRG